MSNIMHFYSISIIVCFVFGCWWSCQWVQPWQISRICPNKLSRYIQFFYSLGFSYLVLLFFLNLISFTFIATNTNVHSSYSFIMIFSFLYWHSCLLLYWSLYGHLYGLLYSVSFIWMFPVQEGMLLGYSLLIVFIRLMLVYPSICLPLTAFLNKLDIVNLKDYKKKI